MPVSFSIGLFNTNAMSPKAGIVKIIPSPKPNIDAPIETKLINATTSIKRVRIAFIKRPICRISIEIKPFSINLLSLRCKKPSCKDVYRQTYWFGDLCNLFISW